jgi:hypothetical protein
VSFPQDPLDLVAELYVGDNWVDITSDVYLRDGITITRGRRDPEAGLVDPSACALTLNNRSGKYSPRNPTGAYYGSLGRNTPLRLAIKKERDAFGRTVSSGWGSADVGGAWSTFGSGGVVQASDYNVSAGVGTHSVPAVNAHRSTYLGSASHRDVDVAVTVTPSVTNVTGGDIQPANILLRGQSTTEYYMVRVVITAAEAVTIVFRHSTFGELDQDPVTVPGLTYSGQALRVRAQIEGVTMRAKVWEASDAEPYDWHASDSDYRTIVTGLTRTPILSPGWIGIRSGVSSSNTNALPVTFSYDDLQVRVPRFSGEVSAWPPRWDTSGNDAHVPIEAAGILRRLGQGESPLQSALRRSVPALGAQLRAYWPCEDDRRATSLSTPLSGGSAMAITTGTPDLAIYDDFDCSAPIPKLNNSTWVGDVPTHTATGFVQLRFLLNVPAAGTTNGGVIAVIVTTGTAAIWELRYTTGGGLALGVFTSNMGSIHDSGALGFNVDGDNTRVSLELTQNGADIDYEISTLDVGALTGPFATNTVAGRTVGAATQVIINPHQAHDDVAVGHIMLQSEVTSFFELSDELAAYDGESAAQRIQRLCEEEDVPAYRLDGDANIGTRAGPQRVDTLLDIIRDAEAADLGTLFEPRGTLGVEYRTRSSLYNQPATVTVDLANNELGQPFQPTDDDRHIRNDVTVKRVEGSEYRAVQDTGPLSVASPAEGGAGRYAITNTVNVYQDSQLPDIATWLRHLGTVDEARYPTIGANLAHPSVVADAALSAGLLALSVDDRVTIVNANEVNIYGTISLLARGYTEYLNKYEHTIDINCAPESPYQVLRLDDALCKLQTDGSQLMAPITSGGTSLIVGRTGDINEDFEDADLAIDVTGTWARTNAFAQAGSWSFKSAAITHSQTTDAVVTVPDDAATLQFWFRVSSESGFDFLRFYIDSAFQGEVSGIVGWTQSAVYDVSSATTVTFRYVKDGSGSAGEDAVYVDTIEFRGAGTWPLWTTTAGQMPIPIIAGGEEMSVTAISGTTVPQTFTVTRSTNGVTKSHSAGTEVSVARRATLAL